MQTDPQTEAPGTTRPQQVVDSHANLSDGPGDLLERQLVSLADGPEAQAEVRERLLAAALDCISGEGWGNLTIADIVRRARVSKRTFYEHFSTKDACLLALFESAASELLLELQAAQGEHSGQGTAGVAAGTMLYLARLKERPRVVRTLLLEILSLGAEGLTARRRVMRSFALFLQHAINEAGAGPPIGLDVATMIVGGINEATLEALEEDRLEQLTELVPAIVRLIDGVAQGQAV